MPTIDARCFIPKSKATGSCDPNGLCWSDHVFHLTQSKWGVAALQIKIANEARFSFPLTVSNVEDGSEADQQGMRKGDQIVAVGLDGHSCLPVQVSFGCCIVR